MKDIPLPRIVHPFRVRRRFFATSEPQNGVDRAPGKRWRGGDASDGGEYYFCDLNKYASKQGYLRHH